MPARQDSLPARHRTRLSGIGTHLKSESIEKEAGGSLLVSCEGWDAMPPWQLAFSASTLA